MTRQPLGALERNFVVDARTGSLEQLIENLAHREHGRTRIDCDVSRTQLPHLATRRGASFDNGDLKSRSSQVDRRGQSPDTCADNDYAPARH